MEEFKMQLVFTILPSDSIIMLMIFRAFVKQRHIM